MKFLLDWGGLLDGGLDVCRKTQRDEGEALGDYWDPRTSEG